MDQTEEIDNQSLQTCIDRGLEINSIEGDARQEFIDACDSIYEDYTSRDEKIKAYVDYVKGL